MADPSPQLARPLFLGPLRRLFGYVDAKGACGVATFLEGLDRIARARYQVMIHALGNIGYLRGKNSHPWDVDKMKRLAAYKDGGSVLADISGFAAFKDNGSQSRLPYFPDGEPGVLILTHGFGGKKENDIDDVHMNDAIRIRQEYVARRAVFLATPGVTTSRRPGRKP